MLGPRDIKDLLPHDGAMLLLDRVERWDDTEIVCRTSSHRDPSNPLRRDAGLPVFSGVEYGAQAMAIHGSLCGGEPGRPGVLAGLRKVICHARRLDDIEGELMVRANLLIGDQDRFLYAFAISSTDRLLLEGEATVVLG